MPTPREQQTPVLRRPAATTSMVKKPKAFVVRAGIASAPGPRNLHEAVHDWKPALDKVLPEHVPFGMQMLEDMSKRGVVVTTHYSGTGAAEMATATILPGRVIFHGACDLNPTCQKVLLNHGPECTAEHVSADIMARCPKHIVDQLRADLNKYQQEAEALVSASKQPGHKGILRDVSLKWVDAAMVTLHAWTPRREDMIDCLRHNAECPAFPARASTSTSGRFHLEIDGINCQPWSKAGKRLGWLDDRSLPCLVLCRTIVIVQPDAVCIECTPGVDFETIRKLLIGYRGDYAITCPTDFGRPVSRKRMYMWFDRLLSVCHVYREVSTILNVASRSLLVGPEIFLSASGNEIRRQYHTMACQASRKPDGPPVPKPVLRRLRSKQPPTCKLRVRDVLPDGLRKRYLEHRTEVGQARSSHGSGISREKCVVVDINQTASWSGAPQSRCAPTIMRSSTLVALFESEDEDRILLPSEMPGVHGLQIPPRVLAELHPKEVGSLVGNSMHVAQIGLFIQYALATRSYLHAHES